MTLAPLRIEEMAKPFETDTSVLLRAARWIAPALMLIGGAASALAGVDLEACRSAATAEGSASRLACDVPFVPSEEERQAIVLDSSNMVQNLQCTLSINVTRADLAAMATTDAWQAPPQVATCDVVTSRGSHVATFSLAPEITLIGGKAIGVRLNVGAFDGTPPMIAKALQSHINFNAAFQDRLMDLINQNLAAWLGAKKRAGT